MPTDHEWTRLIPVLSSLPADQAEFSSDVPLAPRTTFQIGGSAQILVQANTAAAVAICLRAAKKAQVPWFVMGWGSNLLIPDEGLRCLVIVLTGELAGRQRHGDRYIAGGGASFPALCRESISAGFAGLEGLAGIPSSVGGALAMNAGAYGQEIFEVLTWAEVVESDGEQRRLLAEDIPHGYRWSVLGKGRVVVQAELHLRASSPDEVKARAREIRQRRTGVLPTEPSAGSVFRNPQGDFAGRLLEAAGCKGFQIGGAQVSHRHANVVINRGGASARDVRLLLHEMWERVERQFGVSLALELKVLNQSGRVVDDPASLA